MNCQRFNQLISEYIDGYIDSNDKDQFELHMKECKECNHNYLSMIEMINDIKNIKEEPLPIGLHQSILKSLKKERTIGRKMKIRNWKWKKISSYAAVFLIGIFLTTAVLSNLPLRMNGLMEIDSASQNSIPQDEAMYDLDNLTRGESSLKNSGNSNKELGILSEDSIQNNDMLVAETTIINNDKIIYSGSINIEVNNYEKSSETIKKYIESVGGFVQNSSSYYNDYNREDAINLMQGNIEVRIPAEKFHEAIEALEEHGEIVNTNVNSTNITYQYRDIENELESLRIQEGRLLDYLKSAKNISEMLEIEAELNRVRTEINWRESQIKNWDHQISYSTLSIRISEVKIPVSVVRSPFGKLLENITKGFIHSVNLLLQLLSNIVILIFKLLPFTPIIILMLWALRKYILKRK